MENKRRHGPCENGFTLIEVVISCFLIALSFLSFEAVMYTQQYFISYSNHKLQAIHAARAVLDIERASGFANIGTHTYLPPSYNGCNMPGAAVTVTVLPPYNDTDPNPANRYRSTVRVTVSWKENMCGVSVTKQESLTTDIANESQLN